MQLAGLLIALALTGGEQAVSDEEIALPQLKAWSERSHCPSMDMLNAASRHYHGWQVDAAFLDAAYSERRKDAGLPSVVDRNEIQRLDASRDHDNCRTLNEWFEAHFLYDADHVHDAQRGEYLPYAYPMYYRVGRRYAILVASYNAGRFEADIPPPPVPGRSRVYVFDEGLGKVGQFSF